MREKKLAVMGLCAVLLAIGAGCEDDDGDIGPGGDALLVATYNAGLAPGYVDLVEARAPRLIEDLSAQPADILCVQEVWLEEHVNALLDASGNQWPYSIFPAPEPGEGGAAPCEPGSLDDLAACVLLECDGLEGAARTACAVDACGTHLAVLPESCANCLGANLTAPLLDILSTCTMPGEGSFTYGGSYGIGLLTRSPILDEDFLVLESSLLRRGVIHAVVDTPELGPVDVFCTHLSAILDVPIPGGGSWQAEQRAQIIDLLEFVEEKTAGGRAIVLGDLNTGPALTGVDAEAPENFELFGLNRFVSIYAQEGADCTYCAENPLVDDQSASVVIDHVLLRDGGLEASAEQFMWEPIVVVAGGEQIETAYSDHFGVIAQIDD